MVSSKRSKKAIFDAAKGERPARRNYTFRLSEELYEKFKKQCEKEGANVTAVLEQLLKDFTNQ